MQETEANFNLYEYIGGQCDKKQHRQLNHLLSILKITSGVEMHLMQVAGEKSYHFSIK